MNIILTHLGLVCSLGTTQDEIIHNAKLGNQTCLNFISTDIPNETVPFFEVKDNKKTHMRCFRLLDITLEQIMPQIVKLKEKYPLNKLGIVLGNTNTGVHEAQNDINKWLETKTINKNFSFEKIELGSSATYLKEKLGFLGPSYVISTACSSSAKAFQSARNLISNNICDAVLVGGVDSRCSFANQGFFSLSAISLKHTNPFSKNRDGINLGEGAALFIMEKEENIQNYETNEKSIKLLGIGESSDAYDLTSPDPTGNGAYTSMKRALEDAALNADQINYINMHGTGTIANDKMEGIAIYDLFNDKILCASTKSLTGHTLGASGAIEAALSWLMLKFNFIIPHKFDNDFDDEIPKIKLAKGNEDIELKNILSNSFAFGGSNCSLILGK